VILINLLISISTLATAALSFGTAALAWRRSRGNSSQIEEVHVLVNQKMTDVKDRVDQLTSTMDDAGLEIPDDPAGGK
jgi:hypothetical protein